MRYSAEACFTPDATTDRLNLKAKKVFYTCPSVRTARHHEWITLPNIKQLSRIKWGICWFFLAKHLATMMISFKTLFQKTGQGIKQSEKQKRNHKKTKVTKFQKKKRFWSKSWAPSSVNSALGEQPSLPLQTDQTLFPIKPQTVIMMK